MELHNQNMEEKLWRSFVLQNDQEARQQLIENHLPLAKHIAFRFYSNRIDDDIEFDDYLQYANLGLIEAIDNFDIYRNVTFSTYATYRIKGSILNGLSSFTEKREQLSLQRRLQKERAQSVVSDDGTTFKDLVDNTLGLAISFMLDDTNLVISQPQHDNNTPYQTYTLYQIKNDIKRIVRSLNKNEQTIIRLHYYKFVNFNQIAKKMNLTKGRVSQIHKNALIKIKDALEMRNKIDDLY